MKYSNCRLFSFGQKFYYAVYHYADINFLSTCERYCRSGDKAATASPANRNRDGLELLPVLNWSLIRAF
ncbi:hypothetical protein LQE92_08460 [Lacrimispora sp. NSJ-141]|uniref:Uncharacterized protein n=1 Tax=Lientehia hominis TaxID=2897778 RepID=A0AAP2W7P7_9FIRM|nr:hypothetical protein [Lientehia hominis]MCD2492658.1 hypothetical protein [Lientehia hominis]